MNCGIMIAKEKSYRFKDKNLLLFEKNIEILIDIVGKENVYMATNDERIKKRCEKIGVNVIWRGVNIIDDEMSYLDVLRYALFAIDKQYDYIISILSNSVGHKKEDIIKGLKRLKRDYSAVEARSFDIHGNQSGVFIFRDIPEKWHHMAMFLDNGHEIHYKEELDGST